MTLHTFIFSFISFTKMVMCAQLNVFIKEKTNRLGGKIIIILL